jgi:DHA1 family inner membrane transport protein
VASPTPSEPPPEGPSPATRSDRVAGQVGLIVLATSFQALAAGGFGLLLPDIRLDLDLSFTEAGSLAATATLVYALMQVPAGVLADRFGAHRLFAIGTIGTNGFVLLISAAGSYLVALVVLALSGFARALAFAPGLVATSSWFRPERRATAMGLFIAGGSLWTILFGILAPAALTVVDWRTVVAGFGAMGLVFGLAYARFGRTGERGQTRASSGPPTIGLGTLARSPVMWMAAFIQFSRLAVVQGVALWLPTFLIDERDLSLAFAGAVVAAMALATAPSNLAGGYLADRWARPFAVIGGALAVLAVALLLLASGTGLAGLVVAIVAIAVCQQLYFGPLFAAPVSVFGPRSAGVVSGVGNLFANLGAFAALLALGAIKDATGSLQGGFVALAVLCGFGVVGTWQLARLVRANSGPGAASGSALEAAPLGAVTEG